MDNFWDADEVPMPTFPSGPIRIFKLSNAAPAVLDDAVWKSIFPAPSFIAEGSPLPDDAVSVLTICDVVLSSALAAPPTTAK
jgi:hypothetical protein